MTTCSLLLGNTAERTAETAYPTGSHLQMLTHDRISNSDQDYVLLMMIQNFHFAKLWKYYTQVENFLFLLDSICPKA